MREHVTAGAGLGEPERPDHAVGVPVTTVVVAVLHPVRVEARLRIDDEHPFGAPRRELRGGALVPVAVGVLVAREDETNRVAGVLGLERAELVFVDDVVGWSDEVPELGAGRSAVVADTGKR